MLATMNSAGYRYAASDQAFYLPAVLRHLEPGAFPRDAPLIDVQAKLMLSDDLAAAIARATHLPLQTLFFAFYVLTLALLFTAAMRLGARFYRTQSARLALAAALTLRHAVAKTGANTLEGYYHPRITAFALGLLAIDAFLERRDRRGAGNAGAWLAGAAVMHPPTALWFGVWLGAAAWVARPRWRAVLAGLAAVLAAAGVTAFARGPLGDHFVAMDAEWLAVIRDKDYLFPMSWPASAWLTNLAAVPIIAVIWRARRRRGAAVPDEGALAGGALTLAVLFFAWLPFNAAHLAIAVQMQLSRVFWLLDVFATIYAVWWLCEGIGGETSPTPRRAGPLVAGVVALASVGRGLYSSFVEFPDRPVFALDVRDPDWRDAMAFARTTGTGSGWLADPLHAAKYGASVRAAGHRDVLVERMKDGALAMYDRGIAMRVADRERAVAGTAWNTPDGARALAKRYELDYLVIDRELDLPLVHRSGSLFVYRIR